MHQRSNTLSQGLVTFSVARSNGVVHLIHRDDLSSPNMLTSLALLLADKVASTATLGQQSARYTAHLPDTDSCLDRSIWFKKSRLRPDVRRKVNGGAVSKWLSRILMTSSRPQHKAAVQS